MLTQFLIENITRPDIMEREVFGTEVTESLLPTHKSKTLDAIKAPRAVKRITFDKSEASPGKTLYVRVPKLNQNEVLVPGKLVLRFDIDLSGGQANNFLVQNVSRALVKKMVVNFAGTILQDTADYDLFKIYEDLFLSQEQGSRAKICARSGLMRATKKLQASTQKTS